MRLRPALVLCLNLCLAAGAGAREGIVRTMLGNGLTVILEEDHSRPLIGVSLCVRGGSRTETPEISGLSHYYEHLMFRGGSKELKPLEFRRKMQQLGEESGGYTTDDYTNYGFTVPKGSFDEAFRLATDAWLNLQVTQDKIDSERQVVLEEYNQDQDRPDDVVYRQLLPLVFQVHPYRTDPLGRREVIEGATLETFRTFYEERYVPNQMILSLVGDFDSDSMLAGCERTWGTRPAGRASFERGLVEPDQREFRFAEKGMPTSTSKVLLAFPIPAAGDRDLPALELAAGLLADGNSSRLWQALKVKSDQAVAVSAWAEQRRDPGLFVISLETLPKKTGDALETVASELQRLKDQPPSMDELARVREMRLAAHERSLQTVFDRAEALGAAEVRGSAFDVDRYPALVSEVGREDISRVVAEYLRPSHASLSIVRPDSAAAFDARAWHEQWRQAWGPEAGAESAAVAAGPERVVLANGVRIIVQPQPASPMVGVSVLVKGGQWAEPPGEAGIANFTVQLLNRGAAGKSQTEIADRLGSLGATLDLSGGPDFTAADLVVPAATHRSALETLADVVTGPTFPPAEIEKMRADLLASIRSMPDRPFENTNRAFYGTLYRNSPYRNPTIGTEQSIGSITPEQIRDFYSADFVGRNVVIAAAGPVALEEIRAWAQQRFGGLAAGSEIRVGGILEKAPPAIRDTVIARDQEQTTYNTGWPTVPLNDPDFIPLRVAAGVLSDRFFFKYVYDKGVAYRSWFYLDGKFGQVTAMNEMGVSPGAYRAVSGEVSADLARFVREPIPPAELEASKRKLVSRYLLGLQTPAALARELATWEISGRGLDAFRRYPEQLRAVTAEQASRAARKYLLPDRYVRVAIGAAGASSRAGRG